MANPFQESFLKAGLVTQKQINKAKQEKHKKKVQKKKDEPSEVSLQVREQLRLQAEKNKEINSKRAQERQKQEQKAQVRQLIEQNKMERDEQGAAYHFVQDNKIRRLFVSEEMIERLSEGELAIVRSGSSYEIVSAKVASQIAKRLEEAVIVFNKKKKER